MSITDICLNQICQQRKLQMLLTTPPTRYTPNNPYVDFPQFTKQQFDMRRKAEILKYKNPTQSNRQTRAQRWANIVNGKAQSNSYPDIHLTQKRVDSFGNVTYTPITVKYPDYYTSVYDISNHGFVYTIVPNARLCVQDLLIPTPTSSSDVPGPIMNLYYDANVPLYNYVNNRNYGILNNDSKSSMWKIISPENTLVPNSVQTHVMYLYIKDGIDNPAYLFNIDIPIAMYIGAVTEYNYTSAPSDFNITASLNINSSDIVVYYNDLAVQTNNLKSPNYKINSHPVNTTTTSFSFDVSYNSSYQAIYNIGTLSLSNLLLYTQPGYIYDIQITCTINAPATNNLNYVAAFPNTTAGLVFNYFPSSTETYGCDINTTQYPTIQNGIIITGIPQV
uniref:Uncharacterized protein n=1 Tax=viral metagenome TaxID=1070528 RepID=A0A6C0DSJ0_9ZZZZ